MLDLLLRGGLVVDGTGASALAADVGIADGRIVSVGPDHGRAARTIDLDGLVVCPGFIDVHTHYDGQVQWDPNVTPSSLHGVTTVLAGNCGFTIAPVDESSFDYVLRLLSAVEGIPLTALLASLDRTWTSFGSWLATLDGRLAVNAGFLAGHSTIRSQVMGVGAVGDAATESQTQRMCELLDRSLAEGALGFSTSRSGHTDHNGDPVPSRFATDDELLSLCGTLAAHEGTWLELSPPGLAADQFDDTTYELMTTMSLRARRPINWNLLKVLPGDVERGNRESKLRASTHAAERGAEVIALTIPIGYRLRHNFLTGVGYDSIPGWAPTMHLPVQEKLRALADPSTRAQLRLLAENAPKHMLWTRWADATIADVGTPRLTRLVGRTLGEIASTQRKDPFDVLLDIVIDDDLATGIWIPPIDQFAPDVWKERAQVFRHPDVVIGGSDAGAHLDMVETFNYATAMLAQGVRQHGVLSLGEAIRLLTSVPARRFGLVDRGQVAVGMFADLVVLDPETIAATTPTPVTDLPGGGWRLTGGSEGISRVFVNGQETLHDYEFTGCHPGTVLRSGTHTRTTGAIRL